MNLTRIIWGNGWVGPYKPGPMMTYICSEKLALVCFFLVSWVEWAKLCHSFFTRFFGDPKLNRGFGFLQGPWRFQGGLNNTLASGNFYYPTWICFCLVIIFTLCTIWYIIFKPPIRKNILELFPSMEQSQIQVFVLLLGWGGSFQGIANLIRITDPCTELGLTGGKLENSSSSDGGTGTNDLLTWYESLKTLNEGLFKYPYWRIK